MEKFDFKKYEGSGCFDENRAEQLYDAGITPEQASRMSPETEGFGRYRATAGYKFANCDLNIKEVAWTASERELCRIQVTGTRVRDGFAGNPVTPRREVVFDGRLKDLVDTVWLGSYTAENLTWEAMASPASEGEHGDWRWKILAWTADHPRPVFYPLSSGERSGPVHGPQVVRVA